MCPCCQDIVRLSDLRLKIPGARRTWLDTFDLQKRKIERKELEFEEVESEIRKEAIERGRGKVPAILTEYFTSN